MLQQVEKLSFEFSFKLLGTAFNYDRYCHILMGRDTVISYQA